MKKTLLVILLFFSGLFIPNTASAHEVYVLNHSQIAHDLQVNTINVFSSLTSLQNILWLLLFSLLVVISLSLSFRISFSVWGIHTAKTIERLSKFALPIIRVVFGVSLIYSAYYHCLFGPELPLSTIPGGIMLSNVLYITGVLFIVGLFTRFLAVIMVFVFLLSILAFHLYMLTYANYFGEILVLLLTGGEAFSIDSLLFKKQLPAANIKLIVFPILRVSFALSLLYSALYIKFLHPALSYDVVMSYHITRFFPFDPLFVVLGAGCIEATIALLFLIGVNMRWNILFFAFWVTLSLLYFGESVWPHFILFGISITLFLYGYDVFTLEQWLVGKSKNLLLNKKLPRKSKRN